jgi:signal transduction histidine kinase/ABC-type multidrug transport system ATPase subunit
VAVVTTMTPTGTATDTVLRAEGLSVRYGPVRALDGVGLTVRRGELVALAGDNGAGKSTFVRCVAGDIEPDEGRVLIGGVPVRDLPGGLGGSDVAVVWQDLALCPNLDVASNLLLGREPGGLLRSSTRLHATARSVLDRLGVPLPDTTRSAATLSGGQQQLLAVARAMREDPALLVLDEPTASLGVAESQQVEQLIRKMRERGATVVLVSHDVDQMFRLADRIVVLRRGRLVADLDPAVSHPDEVVAAMAGQQLETSPRRQLDRLHGLVDRLAQAEPSSSIPLVLSALGNAIGARRLALHLSRSGELRLAASVGLLPGVESHIRRIPLGPAGGPPGEAAAVSRAVVELTGRGAPSRWGGGWQTGVGALWAVPFTLSGGDAGVITVFHPTPVAPPRAELELVAVYAGHAASALEREHLLGELTSRNRVLETIREVLETLAGPGSFERRLRTAVVALSSGLAAREVGLASRGPGGSGLEWLAYVSPARVPGGPSPLAADAATVALTGRLHAGVRASGPQARAAAFPTPVGTAVLVASWAGEAPAEAGALLDDAANSLRLAFEREEAQKAHQEAAAARRSQELQRQFLSRLSHELRTPLTAIRGYASSLLAPDVTWDAASQDRFLRRIAAESARLGRLVGDLLDFSSIESSVLRLHLDWCDLALVIDAAVACLDPAVAAASLHIACDPHLPPILADHDRLEQVFVNLLDNAVRHNPPGTPVSVCARCAGDEVAIAVSDAGVGLPPDGAGRRAATAGAGLGLSIARGIVAAHGGRLQREPTTAGTSFRIHLPIEGPPGAVLPEGTPVAEVP